MDRRPRHDSWSPDEVEFLKREWAKGLSASQIASLLRGRSRSAVIGMVARLRKEGVLLEVRAKPPPPAQARVPATPPASKMEPRAAPAVSKPLPPPESWRQTSDVNRKPPRPVTARLPPPTARPWVERGPGECQWPFEVDGAFLSCCAPRHPGEVYCEGHCRIAYPAWSPEAAEEKRAKRQAQALGQIRRSGLAA